MEPIIIKLIETKSFICFQELYSGKHFDLEKSDFKNALEQFKIWRSEQDSTSFSAELFRLMSHADNNNIRKILTGFPEETIVYLLWYHSDTEAEFYKRYDRKDK